MFLCTAKEYTENPRIIPGPENDAFILVFRFTHGPKEKNTGLFLYQCYLIIQVVQAFPLFIYFVRAFFLKKK